MAETNVELERLITSGGWFSSADVSARSGVSRQAVHKHLTRLVAQGALTIRGKARATQYRAVAEVRALSRRVEVASAGSRFRLSVRLLLLEVDSGVVEVDFTGVDEVTDEFLEELFLVWAPSHPAVTLKPTHLPSRCAASFFAVAKRASGLLHDARKTA